MHLKEIFVLHDPNRPCSYICMRENNTTIGEEVTYSLAGSIQSYVWTLTGTDARQFYAGTPTAVEPAAREIAAREGAQFGATRKL